jgi:protein arginine kinase
MLTVRRRLDTISHQLEQMGLLMRGTYGEGSIAAGGICQISNRVTLGVTEEEILDRLETAAEQIISAEERLREGLSGAEADRLTDRVRRAEGILRYAHTLSARELLQYASDLRMGTAMGLCNLRIEALTALLIEAMPATLTLSAKEPPKLERERDILRAQMVKETLFGA